MNHFGECRPANSAEPGELAILSDIEAQAIIEAIHLRVAGNKAANALVHVNPCLKRVAKTSSKDYFRATAKEAGHVDADLLLGEYGIEVASNGPELATDLEITTDVNNNIALNRGQPLTLSRRLRRIRQNTPTDESTGNAIRLKALKVLAGNPDKTFRRIDLWRELNLGEYDRMLWATHVEPFLHEPPIYKGEPLVQAIRVSSQMNRYTIGNFNVTFRENEKPLEVEDDVFVFDNGRRVAGRSGIMLKMLLDATPEDPVLNEDILSLYTPEEQAKLNYPSREALQHNVSGIRAHYLTGQDTDLVLWRVVTDEKNPETRYRLTGFYLEPRLSLAEAGSICQFLSLHQGLLKAQGIQPPSDELVGALQEGILNDDKPLLSLTSAELKEQRRESFEKILRILGNPKQLDSFIEYVSAKDPHDPRLATLEYFRGDALPDNFAEAIRQVLTSEYKKPPHKFLSSKKYGGLQLVQERAE